MLGWPSPKTRLKVQPGISNGKNQNWRPVDHSARPRGTPRRCQHSASIQSNMDPRSPGGCPDLIVYLGEYMHLIPCSARGTGNGLPSRVNTSSGQDWAGQVSPDSALEVLKS